MTELIKSNHFRLYQSVVNTYHLFLQRIVLKLFFRPDIAIRCAVNTMSPTPERVISNFMQGIYLMGGKSREFVWGSTAERAIITRETAHISRSVRRYMRNEDLELGKNERFDEVIEACKREEWTWINESIVDLYTDLNRMGYAKSYEAYKSGELVAGMWGLELGKTYSIMSMFHNVNRAGSVVLGTVVKKLMEGEIDLIDCGQMNNNFKRYGAFPVSTEVFVEKLIQSLSKNPVAVNK